MLEVETIVAHVFLGKEMLKANMYVCGRNTMFHRRFEEGYLAISQLQEKRFIFLYVNIQSSGLFTETLLPISLVSERNSCSQ